LDLNHIVPKKYELSLNFPKKSYTNSRTITFGSDSNLFPKAMLMIKELE
jgi:hypothetical protein